MPPIYLGKTICYLKVSRAPNENLLQNQRFLINMAQYTSLLWQQTRSQLITNNKQRPFQANITFRPTLDNIIHFIYKYEQAYK